MAEISVNSTMLGLKSVSLHVDDYGGDGRPVVLIHGWPLSSKSWGEQVQPLVDAGFRVITYDRRGFGESDKPASGYDYDTFAEDLDGILENMDIRDASLVGFSMGGGEIARYIAKYGEERLHSVVFASAIPPYLLKTVDNPDGPLDATKAEEMAAGLAANDTEFYKGFMKQFFSPNGDGNVLVSDAQISGALEQASQADKNAAMEAMKVFGTTDFRDDLTKISVPTLVIHGDADAIVPLEGSGALTHEHVAGSEYHVVKNGPHGINVSHTEEFNDALIRFLQK